MLDIRQRCFGNEIHGADINRQQDKVFLTQRWIQVDEAKLSK